MATFEQLVASAIDSGKMHGIVLAARNRSGQQYSRAVGTRTLLNGSKVPLQTSDIIFVASCTKLLTTIAILQCVEKGQLALEEDLRPRLPALAKMGVFKNASGTEDGTIEPLTKALTLRHLLSHSSGLSYDFMNPVSKHWRASHPYTKTAGKNVPERFTFPLLFQPGEGWEYSVGLDWAGHIVEECSGMRLDEYFRKYILSPLGIPPTEFTFLPIAEGLSDRMADLNPDDPHGYGLAVSAGFNIHEADSTTCFGGGGGYTTIETVITILHSLLLDDGKLLSSQSIAELHKPQLEPAAKEAFDKSQTSALAGDGHTGARPSRDHSLVGVLVTSDNDSTGLGNGSVAWGGGVNSGWMIDPVNGTCGFLAPQLTIPADFGSAWKMREAFTKELAGSF